MAEDGNSLSRDSNIILALRHDALDNGEFEEEVTKLATHVQDGFCLQCQALFDDWPDLQDMPFDSSDDPGS